MLFALLEHVSVFVHILHACLFGTSDNAFYITALHWWPFFCSSCLFLGVLYSNAVAKLSSSRLLCLSLSKIVVDPCATTHFFQGLSSCECYLYVEVIQLYFEEVFVCCSVSLFDLFLCFSDSSRISWYLQSHTLLLHYICKGFTSFCCFIQSTFMETHPSFVNDLSHLSSLICSVL